MGQVAQAPGSDLLGWRVSPPLQIENDDRWWVVFGSPTNIVKVPFNGVSDAFHFCRAMINEGAQQHDFA